MNYEDVDVRGKIVLATGSGAAVHRKALIERGALGILRTPSGRGDRQDYPDLLEMQRLSPTPVARLEVAFS